VTVQAQVANRSGDEQRARVALKHILKVCHKEDVNRCWALNYLREMNEKDVT
jgi:hypothetical protein